MRVVLLFIIYLLCLPAGYGQNKFERLLQKGVDYHDAGQYDKAIEVYKQILQEDSTSVEAMYEMSFSLLQAGQFEEAIKYCDKLIDRDDKYAILAYNTKGSALNYLDKTDESIAVYLEGIERYEDFPQLYYNLGLAYFSKKEYLKAKEAFLQTLKLNPKHSGGHLNLGRTMAVLKKRPESLLGLYYFLMLEPATDRSEWAYNAVQEQLYDLNESESDYKAADNRLISLLEENEQQIKESDSVFKLFVEDTSDFFSVLNDIQEKTDPTEATVWDNYISFFKTLAIRGHTEAFCYYISHSFIPEDDISRRKSNDPKLTNFARWLAQQE